jgi:hypothetical protein
MTHEQRRGIGSVNPSSVRPPPGGRPGLGSCRNASAMNPAGSVRCNIMPVARGYSSVSQPLF